MNLGQVIAHMQAAKEDEEMSPIPLPVRKIDYAELGRLGGLKGGTARAKRLSPERRREIASMGGIARHAKKRQQLVES